MRLFVIILASIIYSLSFQSCSQNGDDEKKSSDPRGQSDFWNEMNKGKSNFDRERYDKSVKHFEHALAIDSSNAEANYNLADAYLSVDSLSLAHSHFSKSIKSSRDTFLNAKSYHNLGVIEQRMANAVKDQPEIQQSCLKNAINDYKSSLKLNPNSDETRYNLALCLKQLKECKQQQKQSPQQEPQKQKQKEQNEKKQPQNQQQQSPKQNNQLMEYAKRKEKETREKMKATYVSPAKSKNW
jgi:Ca-activated chloride channel family protein